MSFSIKLGNFLYKHAFVLYKPMYTLFKNRQDAYEISLLKKHIKNGDVVLDIGANIGFYANILSQLVGETGLVHCFEPDGKNFGYLKSATQNLKNVVINNKAAGPKTETLKIYTSKNLNVDHRTYKPDDYDQEIEVQALAVDDYLGANLNVNLVKIDIQGFELHAMKGMQKLLAHNKNIRIVSEFWPYGLNKAGNSLLEYFNFLKANGFNCYLLDHHSLAKLDEHRVKSLEGLGEEHYFNIFASRNHV